MNPHILVVDDDPEIRQLLGRYLKDQGFRVSLAADGAELRRQLATNAIDLIVLDILLPDGSGLSLCRELRAEQSTIGIVLLTALKEDVDRIIGLEIGADDYLGKPFNPRELVARIRTVLRRTQANPKVPRGQIHRFAGFQVDPSCRSVKGEAGSITLTAGEFDLLIAFLERPGQVLSRDTILELTQGGDTDSYGRSIDVLMSRLRRKLRDSSAHELFKTVRNGGYILAAHVESSDASP